MGGPHGLSNYQQITVAAQFSLYSSDDLSFRRSAAGTPAGRLRNYHSDRKAGAEAKALREEPLIVPVLTS